MQRRIELGILGLLVVVLVLVYLHGRDSGVGLTAVQAMNQEFVPLNVQEPQLRLDMLEKLQKSTYSGTHRNVFVFGPAPPPSDPLHPGSNGGKGGRDAGPIGPRYIPPAPVSVNAQFFGSALMEESGRRVAFFQNGEDVMVVPEGDTFMTRFRLVHVGPESADVLEISTGRHAQVPMVPPVQPGPNPGPGQPAPPPTPDSEQ